MVFKLDPTQGRERPLNVREDGKCQCPVACWRKSCKADWAQGTNSGWREARSDRGEEVRLDRTMQVVSTNLDFILNMHSGLSVKCFTLVWVLFSAATEGSFPPHCCCSSKCTPLSCKYSSWCSGILLLSLLLSSWWPWTGHCPHYSCRKALSGCMLTLPLTFSVIAGPCMVHMH